MDQKKIEKFASIIQKELGEIILREIDLPRNSFITITKVIVSPDKRKAKILIGVTPSNKTKEILNLLLQKKRHLRSLLAHRLDIKRVPEIYFLEDKGLRVEELLQEIDYRSNN
ncbi:30S ribosome-binding factor RbfA [bacterium]|nr:30S ribosome-binding factor RbfA [bacterium]